MQFKTTSPPVLLRPINKGASGKHRGLNHTVCHHICLSTMGPAMGASQSDRCNQSLPPCHRLHTTYDEKAAYKHKSAEFLPHYTAACKRCQARLFWDPDLELTKINTAVTPGCCTCNLRTVNAACGAENMPNQGNPDLKAISACGRLEECSHQPQPLLTTYTTLKVVLLLLHLPPAAAALAAPACST